MSVEFGPRLEELVTIEDAFLRYKDTVMLSNVSSWESCQQLVDEIEARLRFRVNVTGVVSEEAEFLGSVPGSMYLRNFKDAEKIYDENGCLVPTEFQDVRIYGVDAPGESLMVALGDDVNQSDLRVLPLHLIETIEVVEPLEA